MWRSSGPPAKREGAERERFCGSLGTCWSEICRADLSPPCSPGSPWFCSGDWNPMTWVFVVAFPEPRAHPGCHYICPHHKLVCVFLISRLFFTDSIQAGAWVLLLALWTNRSEIIKLCGEDNLHATQKYVGWRREKTRKRLLFKMW